MKFAAKLLILGVLVHPLSSTDYWRNLHPEYLHDWGCSTNPVDLQMHGAGITEQVWMDEARGNRPALAPEAQRWSMEIFRIPRGRTMKQDQKARHRAEKACSRWIDKTEEMTWEMQHGRGR